MLPATAPSPVAIQDFGASQNYEFSMPARAKNTAPRVIRRRPNLEQGRALEILGHAVEYLVDSRMYAMKETAGQGDVDAVQILSRCSREVFSTCSEIVPIHKRFKQWASERLHTDLLHARHGRA